LIQSPTSGKDIDVSLSAVGYTSVFVHVPPSTPSTPQHLARPAMKNPFVQTTTAFQPPSPKKSSSTRRTIKQFRSLGLLRPRSKTIAGALSSPTKLTSPPLSSRARAEVIAKYKKAKYGHARPPPPMANEIALMQFADGGSVESNIRRLMEEKARTGGGELGVGDVYRDGKGGVWMDQDEEMEYVHLLGGGDDSEGQWIKFGNDKVNEDEFSGSPRTGIVDLANRASFSTQDSDLSPRHIVLPAEESQCGPEDVVLSFSVPRKSPFKTRPQNAATPGLSVLSLPSRPRRTAKHLHKPEFLIDVAAFGPRSPGVEIRISPKSPLFPSSASSPILPPSLCTNNTTPVSTSSQPHTPKSARSSSAFVQFPPAPSGTNGGKAKKVKRRPTPLELATTTGSNVEWENVKVSRSSQTVASRAVSTTSTGIVAEARREFVKASFVPSPVIHRVPAARTPVPHPFVTRTPRILEDLKPQQRGKVVIASLDPMDDIAKCREWAAASGTMDVKGDVQDAIDLNVSGTSESVVRKRRGFGGLFRRK
jgi:hypothetical protein